MIGVDDKSQVETHYMQLESEIDKFTIGPAAIGEFWRSFRNPKLKFDNFTITDFDYCL